MATENFCNIDWIDDPSGNLSLGAIGSISSTDNDNVVFVIDRGYVENGQTPMDRGSVKARVIREGENYSISYGDIDDSSFTTLTIPKDPNYNFIFFSFDNGIVNVEPEKTNWDISMTTSTLPAEFGPGVYVSYNYKDISLSNHNNVKISSVEVTDIINYNDFTLAEANALILENNRMGIGTSWRTLVSREAGYILNSDIFYVIEDPSGNLYKLKFTRMFCISGDCAGERGYPEFTYELMK